MHSMPSTSTQDADDFCKFGKQPNGQQSRSQRIFVTDIKQLKTTQQLSRSRVQLEDRVPTYRT